MNDRPRRNRSGKPTSTGRGRAPSSAKGASRAPSARRLPPVSADERLRMIAEAAYFRAERRGFQEGDPTRDWLEAEEEIDAALLSR